ncbi:helix-turn-helix domain-containing protein, partial [Streptomyces sp. NPDC048279]|uniref:helix-turn-helix domain-containing protein n=1 Tax=Streptomyces sp. NPDC048279 TaxID=3154714 RepID=UPI00341CC7C4
PTVRTWRERFRRRGAAALFDRPRSGRPKQHGPSARLAAMTTATSVPPEGATLRTRATIAAIRPTPPLRSGR